MRVIYFDIDSCRPDHLSCYGYHRPTSPSIDSVARNGVQFANCYASDTPCLPSRAALFSGRLGIRNGVTTHDGPGQQLRYPGDGQWRGPAIPMWMEVLQHAGWTTASFSGFARRHRAWWFTAGFTEFYGHQFPGGSETAEDVNHSVIPWLKQHGGRDNWFLHVNYWDAHTPYNAPDRLVERMAALSLPSYPDANALKRDRDDYYGPQTARDQWYNYPGAVETYHPRMVDDIATRELFGQLVNGYDGGIAYVDEAIGQILETLETLGIRDETAFVVSADHGEAIGELGMYFEHGNATEGVTHVPLIVAWPGAAKGSHVDALVYQLDLCPTILDLLGHSIPNGWDGESFAAALRGDVFRGRDFIVRGCGIYSFQRALRQGDWLLIQTLHPGLYPLDPVYLFNLREDPHERVNLAETNRAKRLELQGLLAEWWSRYCTGPNSVRDPFQSTMEIGPDGYYPPAKMVARLRSLGRADQLRDLQRRRPDLVVG